MSKADFTVDHALICDDYRVEAVSNKGIVIGLYTGTIGFASLPANWGFCVCLIGHASHDFMFEFRIRYEPSDDSDPAERKIKAGAQIVAPSEGEYSSFFLAMPKVALNITSEGTLDVNVRPIGGTKWRKVRSYKVELNPAFANAQ